MTGAEQDLVALLHAGDVSVRKVIAFADFQDVKAFFDETGTELPNLFKLPVGIDDHPDVLGRAVCSDTKVICHFRMRSLFLCLILIYVRQKCVKCCFSKKNNKM